jgi:SAM-dependent methyltransferase
MATRPGEQARSRLRREARRIYGTDPQGYAAGRPDYPEELYAILSSRCGLRAGASVVEIGPGTGLVTRRLVAVGARVTAVEPDRNMVAYLAAAVGDVEIVSGTFEQVPLPPGSFDLAVAGTSFHWVDQAVGLPKLGKVLRPGGWAALWWTVFDDPGRQDVFADALRAASGCADPGGQRDARFQLDAASRCRDLAGPASLDDVRGELIRWTADLDSTQLRALYASMITIRILPADDQRRILDQIWQLAETSFAGRVQRPFVTALYTGRRPN